MRQVQVCLEVTYKLRPWVVYRHTHTGTQTGIPTDTHAHRYTDRYTVVYRHTLTQIHRQVYSSL